MDKIRQIFLDLSLRKSVIFYITIFIAAALFLSVITSASCQTAKNKIYASYLTPSERYYLTNEDGEQLGEGALIGHEAIILPDSDQNRIAVLNMLPLILTPLYCAACMLAAVMLFYHHKLKKPLSILETASQNISDNNLNFLIDYTCKDEMGKLCASFEKMRYALLKSNTEMWRQMEERKRLNAAFAHDLRTPLTILKGYSEILHNATNGISYTDTTETMTKHINRLERYVESMSNMQKMEDITPSYRETVLSDFISSIQQTTDLICKNAGKEFNFYSRAASNTVWVDTEIIAQVFENLISNAVYYAMSKVETTVTEIGNTIEITISDDGDGFSSEGLQRASEPYYTEHTDKSAHFGLGLYICKLLCHHHSGRLKLENMESGGRVTASFEKFK
ncbi:MAG: HAMP domain-containing histidine kinase [Clostridiales bacterium]|jgi:K+-sensing histidine kinase KdpD|nr:HAMP domain-containing histidine kinase [Clostridiales bacterium]